jgi:hypothetical protein
VITRFKLMSGFQLYTNCVLFRVPIRSFKFSSDYVFDRSFIVKVKFAPLPMSENKVNLPPNYLTSLFEIIRPSPIPLVFCF